MKHSIRLIPLAALSAIALAACGSSGNNPTIPSLDAGTQTHATAPSTSASLADWRAAVECARQHERELL
jgi:hypothetical protein